MLQLANFGAHFLKTQSNCAVQPTNCPFFSLPEESVVAAAIIVLLSKKKSKRMQMVMQIEMERM